ncbi:helix-turn-helix transcriptional regulator [Brevundimonas sp.]|uniref:AraC family transcriptional regulator n=1 Tax=Brevundimonas sp. TaxID=1871086 RepID=UPI003D11E8E8
MSTTTWTTQDVAPGQRFEFWREERAKAVFGVQIEVDRDKRDAFEGHFTARQVGEATIVDLRASAYHLRRVDRDIADSPADAFCILQQMRGGGLFGAGGREYVGGPGAMAVGYSDRPYYNVPGDESAFHSRAIKLPFARVASLLNTDRDLSMRLMIPNVGAPALLAAYATAFVDQAPGLSADGAEIAVDTLVRLALLAWTETDEREPANVAAIRRGRLSQAHTLIEHRIADPALSPTLVASALSISVRQLNLLFETSGTSFTAHLRRRRLNRAHQMLLTSPWLTITEIAYAIGFDSMATFYRGFRAEYDCTPAEVRQERR